MSTLVSRLLLGTLFALFGLTHAADHQLPGRVIRVVDGDSLILDVRGSRYRIELFGIDAPELNQPWGRTATDRLYSLLTGRFVVITGANPGEDGVVAGSLTFRDRDVALDLIHDGLAWSTIPPENDGATLHPYPAAEFQARIARRGLWSDETPIPPWEWRRQHPGNTD